MLLQWYTLDPSTGDYVEKLKTEFFLKLHYVINIACSKYNSEMIAKFRISLFFDAEYLFRALL